MIRCPLLLVLLLLAAGCRGEPVLRDDLTADQAYQTISDALPQLSLGVAEPPGVIALARSNKIPRQAPAEELEVFNDERSFRVRINTLITRVYVIPYEAITDIEFEYQTFPNLIYCVLLPFIQSWELRLVFDTTKAPALAKTIPKDIERLRAISKEISLPGPYYFAEELEDRSAEIEERWGPDRLELVRVSTSFVPPWIPYSGSTRRIAEAFHWARNQTREPE